MRKPGQNVRMGRREYFGISHVTDYRCVSENEVIYKRMNEIYPP